MLRFTIASTSASAAVAFSAVRRAVFFNRSARALSLSTVRFLGMHTSKALNAPGTIKPHGDHTGIESAYDFSRSFDRHSRAARPIWVQSEREMQ